MSGYKHGMFGTPIYIVWCGFKRRTKPYMQERQPQYKGITYYEGWENFLDFYEWALENGYKDGLTLDRIDNSKGYYPDNCRFATHVQQNNNRTNNRLITWNGKTQPVGLWEKELGWKKHTLRARLDRGWSLEDCFNVSVTKRNQNLNKKVQLPCCELGIIVQLFP